MPQGGHDPTTLTENSDELPKAARAPRVPALVLLWCSHEPHRAGEVCFLPAGDPGAERIFGRGAERPEDEKRRVALLRQQPSNVESSQPVSNPRISRQQLILNAL